MQHTKCENCGAPLTAYPDGSLPPCNYCEESAPRGGLDPRTLAAQLERGASGGQGFLESLAKMLEEPAFASFAQVEKSGFFSKSVSAVKVSIKHDTYRLEVGGGGHLVGHRSKTVHGVALKNETLPLKQWLEEFSLALAQLAQESKDAEKALGRFVR